MKTALWFQPSRFTAVAVWTFVYFIWAIAAVDNILLYVIFFPWHLLSFLLFIKLGHASPLAEKAKVLQ